MSDERAASVPFGESDAASQQARQVVRERSPRAPKPLSVPAAVALIGLGTFLFGMVVASADMAALGMLLLLWGVSSFSVLYLTRRRRARTQSPHSR
jgi:hypothetical protein